MGKIRHSVNPAKQSISHPPHAPPKTTDPITLAREIIGTKHQHKSIGHADRLSLPKNKASKNGSNVSPSPSVKQIQGASVIQSIPLHRRTIDLLNTKRLSRLPEIESISLTSNVLHTRPHHIHQSSLYGPIPEVEKLIIAQHLLDQTDDDTSTVLELEGGPVVLRKSQDGDGGTGAGTAGSPKTSVGSGTGKRKKVFHRAGRWLKRKCGQLSDISEDDRVDAVGEWDYWKGYYCSNHPMMKKYNEYYFAWILLLSIGQCSFMDLLHYIAHYGCVFFLISTFTYIGIGYPLYLLETAMGQYSGRKPLQMLRYLCPMLSGLGLILYFRTILQTLRVEAIFLYSVSYALDLYFCHINANEFLYHFYREDNNKTASEFIFGKFTTPDMRDVLQALLLGAFLVTIFVAGTLKINTLGKTFSISIKILALAHVIYFIVIMQRVIDATATATGNTIQCTAKNSSYNGFMKYVYLMKEDTKNKQKGESMFGPTSDFLRFKWKGLLDGRAWIDAVLYAISSLSCGTLVHSYLGSRSLFHYRTARDGVLLIICTILWNMIGVFSMVLWLNYIVVNEKQVENGLTQLGGPYGLFMVYMLQLLQAQLSLQNESDIFFFTGIFYTTIGGAALLGLNAHLHILTHCAYPEKASVGIKIVIFIVISILFSIVFPVLLISQEGLKHLVWIDFYANQCMAIVIFVVACFFWCISYGHTLTKFVYDFRNMMHFEIFGASRVSAKYGKFLRIIVSICFGLILLYSFALYQYPRYGMKTANYYHSAYYGLGIQLILCLAIFVIAGFIKFGCKGFTGRSKQKNRRPMRPHRDWFKNRFHYKVCFIQKRTKDMGEESSENSDSGSANDSDSLQGSA